VAIARGDREIALNLWYLYDDQGLIYSLRGRAYVAEGTDEQKLEYLRRFADTDFLIAQVFPVPRAFHTRIREGGEEKTMAVATAAAVREPRALLALFEDAIREIEAQLPSQTALQVSRTPVVCVTPLLGDDAGAINPSFGGSLRFEGR
jgi:hypothetical protein